jgi:hypothetical protein
MVNHPDARTEAYLSFNELDAGICSLGCGLIVKGKHDTSDALDDEKECSDTPYAIPPALGEFRYRLAQELRQRLGYFITTVDPFCCTVG